MDVINSSRSEDGDKGKTISAVEANVDCITPVKATIVTFNLPYHP